LISHSIRLWTALLLSLPLLPAQLIAAESGARSYANAPVGLNVLQAVAVRSESANGSLRLSSHAGVVRYFKYVDVFGQAGLIGGFAPYAEAKLDVPAAGLHQRINRCISYFTKMWNCVTISACKNQISEA